MKQIVQYINEKYLIDTDTKYNIDIEKYKNEVKSIFTIIYLEKDWKQHEDVLKACKRQNVDIDKMIKHLAANKLVCRWFAAIVLEWDEAIQKIAKEIEFRKIFDIEVLHAFIIKRYEQLKYEKEWKEHFENYFKLYDLDI